MNWSWTVFVIALIACTILSQFARGAMNSANVAKYGSRADYRATPGMAMLGSVFAGAVCAAIITVVVGAIF